MMMPWVAVSAAFLHQKHSFYPPICMLLRGKNMPIAPQNDAFCSVISLFFVKKSDFAAR